MSKDASKQIIVGIDPDKELSGFGMLVIETDGEGIRRIKAECSNWRFPELIKQTAKLSQALGEEFRIKVWVEAGWLEKKSNHHGWSGPRAEKIARDVGANHQTGRLILETLRSLGIDAQEIKPLIKCWKGADRKITHEELDRIMQAAGGMPRKRSNQEERDALLIAWAMSGLPIRL